MTQFVVYLSGRNTFYVQGIQVSFVQSSDRSCVGRGQVPNMMEEGGWWAGAAGVDPRLQRAQMIAAAQQQVQQMQARMQQLHADLMGFAGRVHARGGRGRRVRNRGRWDQE